MQVHPGVVSRRLGDEVVIVRLDTDEVYSLNQSAARIWELVVEGLDARQIRDRLLSEISSPPDGNALEASIAQVLGEFCAEGFIAVGRPPTLTATLPIEPTRPSAHGWVAAYDAASCQLNVHAERRPHLYVHSESTQTVLFDGWLYEPAELASSLGLPPSAASNPAALVLAAQRVWPDRFAERIRGVYSFVIADRQARRLTAVRDRIGQRPLFFVNRPGGPLFSDSIAALLEQPDVSRELDPVVVAGFIGHVWPRAEETCFKRVRRVTAATVLTYSEKGLTERKYWQIFPDGEPQQWASGEASEAFADLFKRAVTRCAPAVPKAIYLSGGLDSVSIAALAMDSAAAPQVALSLIFPDPSFSEIDRQKSVAQQLGLRLIAKSFDEALAGRSLVEAALSFSATLDAPLQNIFRPAFSSLDAELAPLGPCSILTGCGGDEWLGVSPFYAADRLRKLDLPGWLGFVRSLSGSYDISRSTALKLAGWTFGIRPLLIQGVLSAAAKVGFSSASVHGLRVGRKLPAWLGTGQVREALIDRFAHQMTPLIEGTFYAREIERTFEHPIVTLELEEFYAAARQNRLSLVHPYWDADLIEFLAKLAPEALATDGLSKSLVRAEVERRFPGLGFGRQKKYVNPQFFERHLLEGIRDHSRRFPTAAALGVLDQMGAVNAGGAQIFVDSSKAVNSDDRTIIMGLWDLLNVAAWASSK